MNPGAEGHKHPCGRGDEAELRAELSRLVNRQPGVGLEVRLAGADVGVKVGPGETAAGYRVPRTRT